MFGTALFARGHCHSLRVSSRLHVLVLLQGTATMAALQGRFQTMLPRMNVFLHGLAHLQLGPARISRKRVLFDLVQPDLVVVLRSRDHGHVRLVIDPRAASLRDLLGNMMRQALNGLALHLVGSNEGCRSFIVVKEHPQVQSSLHFSLDRKLVCFVHQTLLLVLMSCDVVLRASLRGRSLIRGPFMDARILALADHDVGCIKEVVLGV